MINVVVASDENYAPHLETLLVSIGENNKYEEQIQVSVFDGGLSEQTQKWIADLSGRYHNLRFAFIQMTDCDIRKRIGGEISQDRSLVAYSRIFIPEIVDGEKAIYLDVDAIVESDLREFYEIDIAGYAIAGVRDSNPIRRHRSVGLSDSQPYINSGMILWNLEKCREINATEQLIRFVRDRNGQVDAMDQGTINGVLSKQGLIKVIHPKYNSITSLFQLNREWICKIYDLPEYYSDDELKDAKDKPIVIHFTPNMTTRPWEKNCAHPCREKYWKYRSLTQYPKKSLCKDKRSFKFRILGLVYQFFPQIYKHICAITNLKYV